MSIPGHIKKPAARKRTAIERERFDGEVRDQEREEERYGKMRNALPAGTLIGNRGGRGARYRKR